MSKQLQKEINEARLRESRRMAPIIAKATNSGTVRSALARANALSDCSDANSADVFRYIKAQEEARLK